MNWLSIRRVRGAPVVVDFFTLVPESFVVQVRWPHGGGVLNVPWAVHVTQRGHTRRHWIVDATRLIQWALWGAAATISILAWVRAGRD
jgi:hypothetical protein